MIQNIHRKAVPVTALLRNIQVMRIIHTASWLS